MTNCATVQSRAAVEVDDVLIASVIGEVGTDDAVNEKATAAKIVGFFGNAAVSGLYSIVAYAFPTHVRATGTGFVVGIGRGGAVMSPWLAGYLFQSGVTLPTVALIMGTGSLLSAGVLILLRLNTDRPILATSTKRITSGPEPSTV